MLYGIPVASDTSFKGTDARLSKVVIKVFDILVSCVSRINVMCGYRFYGDGRGVHLDFGTNALQSKNPPIFSYASLGAESKNPLVFFFDRFSVS